MRLQLLRTQTGVAFERIDIFEAGNLGKVGVFVYEPPNSSHAWEEDAPRSKPKPKPNPKIKAAAKFKQPRNVPAPLKGLKTRAEKGNVCWDYNLEGGCQGEVKRVDGIDRCSKGLRICAGCHKPGRSYLNCRSKKE